jgi:hypothetical protein
VAHCHQDFLHDQRYISKQNAPLCLTTGATGTPLYHLAKHPAGPLALNVGYTENHIKNSADLTYRLQTSSTRDADMLISSEVVILCHQKRPQNYTCQQSFGNMDENNHSACVIARLSQPHS